MIPRLVKAKHFDADADIALGECVAVIDATYVVRLLNPPYVQLPRCQVVSCILSMEAKWYIDIAIEPGGVIESMHRSIVTRCNTELLRAWSSSSAPPRMRSAGGVVHHDVALGIDVLRIRCPDDHRDTIVRTHASCHTTSTLPIRSLQRGMHMVCVVRVYEVLVLDRVATYNIELCCANVISEDHTLTSAAAQALRRHQQRQQEYSGT